MIIDDNVLSYLSGQTLSNGAWFNIAHSPLRSRNSALMDLARGCRVVHLGCADHPDLIQKKRASGTYLHDILAQSAKSLIGVDTNAEAIEQMRSLGISGLWHVDQYVDVAGECDLLLVPDVIEHVPNVGEFLESLRNFNAARIVIATPNAYRLANRGQWKAELVNTDHHYWFSPYTLAKSLYSAGFRIEEFHYTDTLSWRRPVDAIRKRFYPLCRDGLLVVFRRDVGA